MASYSSVTGKHGSIAPNAPKSSSTRSPSSSSFASTYTSDFSSAQAAQNAAQIAAANLAAQKAAEAAAAKKAAEALAAKKLAQRTAQINTQTMDSTIKAQSAGPGFKKGDTRTSFGKEYVYDGKKWTDSADPLLSAQALLAQLLAQPQIELPTYSAFKSDYPDMQQQLQSIANNPISSGGDIVNPTVDFLSLWSGNETAQAAQANQNYATQAGAITDASNAQTNRNNTIVELMNELFGNEYQTGTLDYNNELLNFNKEQEAQDVKEWNVKAALQKIDRGIANEDDYKILNIALNTPALAQIISQWQMANGLMPDTPAYGY